MEKPVFHLNGKTGNEKARINRAPCKCGYEKRAGTEARPYPNRSPAERVRFGEDEQWNERDFGSAGDERYGIREDERKDEKT